MRGESRRQRTSGFTHAGETPPLCVEADPTRPAPSSSPSPGVGRPRPAAPHVLTGHLYNVFGGIPAFLIGATLLVAKF